MMLLPIILIVVLIMAFPSSNRVNKGKRNSNAYNILSERFAIGEISEEEFIRKMKMLGYSKY